MHPRRLHRRDGALSSTSTVSWSGPASRTTRPTPIHVRSGIATRSRARSGVSTGSRSCANIRCPTVAGYHGLIPFSLMWSEIARSYKTRYVNEGLHVYWQDQQVRLSHPTGWSDDAYGSMLESGSIVSNDIAYFTVAPKAFTIMAIKYSRSAFHSRGRRSRAVAGDRRPAGPCSVAGDAAGRLAGASARADGPGGAHPSDPTTPRLSAPGRDRSAMESAMTAPE